MPTTSAVEESRVAGSGGGCTAGEIMLFGVRVVVDSMRKSVSLNNLAQYEQPHESLNINNSDNIRSDFSTAVNHKDAVDSGYASADDAGPNPSGNRERKRGVPWTEEEHKLFLLGLQKVGKGDWRGISRDFVKTRTPTQVASHAQKYFIRRSNLNRRRRRSSLFDITTDTVSSMPLQEEQAQHCQEITSQSHSLPPSAIPEPSNINGFALMPTYSLQLNLPAPTNNLFEKLTSPGLVHPISAQSAPCSNLMADLNLNLKSSSTEVASSGLSLRLSLTLNPKELSQRHPGFEAMPSFTNGDNIISVS